MSTDQNTNEGTSRGSVQLDLLPEEYAEIKELIDGHTNIHSNSDIDAGNRSKVLSKVRPPCKPNTPKRERKIKVLEWKFEQALERGQKATARRIFKSYENLINKPIPLPIKGFRTRFLKRASGG